MLFDALLCGVIDMFGINKIKERLEFVENELKYQREVAERKVENKKMKKKYKRQMPIINMNDLV